MQQVAEGAPGITVPLSACQAQKDAARPYDCTFDCLRQLSHFCAVHCSLCTCYRCCCRDIVLCTQAEVRNLTKEPQAQRQDRHAVSCVRELIKIDRAAAVCVRTLED